MIRFKIKQTNKKQQQRYIIEQYSAQKKATVVYGFTVILTHVLRA